VHHCIRLFIPLTPCEKLWKGLLCLPYFVANSLKKLSSRLMSKAASIENLRLVRICLATGVRCYLSTSNRLKSNLFTFASVLPTSVDGYYTR
jgi:hypothetical protein